MMDAMAEADLDTLSSLRAAAEAYCVALHDRDVAALTRIFHENAHLYAVGQAGLIDWPRQHFLDRVAGRDPAPVDMAPDYSILSAGLAGPEMGHVELDVAVPPWRFTDYLNFLKIDGEWRVIAKIFRVADGPAI